MTSVASLLEARADDDRVGLRFEDRSWTWRQVVLEGKRRAGLWQRLRQDGPPHIGVLLDNTPEYLFWIQAASHAGATIVGINPTRRGAELERDITHTDCQIIVTDRDHLPLLEGLSLPSIVLVDDPDYSPGDPVDLPTPDPSTLGFLLFTSGSTSAPKAVMCSTGRMAMAGVHCTVNFGVNADDVCYVSMPMFHGNALMACWAPGLAAGSTIVLRRKFSASGFLPDVRRYGITYFTYVGRTIAYILAQPPNDHDRDHHLRLGFGTEASGPDRERFAERFGCPLLEGYGSSESVVVINRTPDTPANALGIPRADLDVAVIDPATSQVCPPAVFDEHGALANGHEAIGEIVNRTGGGMFEGYYNNGEATGERLRNGWYWTGDLAYMDADGFYYFAGRSADWLRVDSENFAAAPVERIIDRYPPVIMTAVYPVPDPRTGDQVMLALELHDEFDPAGFEEFLAAQRDLGTKWTPRFIRIVEDMPLTANNKVHKPPLRAERWNVDPVWWKPGKGDTYRRLTDDDRAAIAAEFSAHGRGDVL